MTLLQNIKNVYLTIKEGSTPSNPDSGDQRLFIDSTDHVLKSVNSSGTVTAVGGGIPWYGLVTSLTPPPSVSTFTAVNQGSATATNVTNGIILYGPSSAGTDIHIWKKAKSPPYTITMCIQFNLLSNWIQSGFIWRESSSGKVVTYGPNFDGSLLLATCTWNSATSVRSYYANAAFPTARPMWFRIIDDNTNRTCQYSADGTYFINFHAIGRTDYITADEIGFYIGQQSNSGQQGTMTILSWNEA